MQGRLVTMSTPELNRLEVLQRVAERRMTQRCAAEMLGLTDRQIRRLLRRLSEDPTVGSQDDEVVRATASSMTQWHSAKIL